MLDRTLFLAWLVAPTEEQRWEISKVVFTKIQPYELPLYLHHYERSRFGSVELGLRRFWLKVAYCLPVWEWWIIHRIRWSNKFVSKLRLEMWLQANSLRFAALKKAEVDSGIWEFELCQEEES